MTIISLVSARNLSTLLLRSVLSTKNANPCFSNALSQRNHRHHQAPLRRRILGLQRRRFLTLSTQTIHTLITISESLKSISTSTIVSELDGEDGRIVLKAQLVILLGKAEEVEETAVPVATA